MTDIVSEMAFEQSIPDLSLYDFLTDFVPGAVLLLYFYLLFPVEDLFTVENTAILVLGLFVGAFVLGHVIQWVRESFGSDPNTFGTTMAAVRAEQNENKEVGEEEFEDGLDANQIHHDFLEKTNQFFEVDDGFDDGERFRLVETYLETQSYQRTTRFRCLLSFYRSMFVVAIIGLALSAIGVITSIIGLAIVRDFPIIALGLGVALLLLVSFNSRKQRFENIYVSYLIREFYLDQVTQNK